MINTTTAYSTTTTPLTGPFGGPETKALDARDSQSKLRDILRDQSRREEHYHYSTTTTTTSSSTSTSPFATSSLSRNASATRVQPARSPSHHTSAAMTNSQSGGYFAIAHSNVGTASPSSKRDGAMSHSPSGLDNYMGSSATLTSHLHRERALRQSAATDQLGAQSETTPAAGNMSRSQSTAGLSNGLDLKVVILGAQGVGKTSLVHRYTSGHFSASSVPSTIGASFLTKKLIVDDVKVRLQLWDTAGQERFRSMAPMYYRGSNAAVIVYDITNPSSFEDVKTWIDELRKNVQSDLVIHIVGSKLDLADHARRINLEDARNKISSWTRPPPPKPKQQPATPIRSRSTFGALGRMSHTSSISASPSSASMMANSRLGGFAALSGLGSKQDENGDADINSPPSAGSSNASAEVGRAEDWDYIEVSEVSSKDNEGIEDVFISIATRLVERKEEMEALIRSRQDRKSVYLSEANSEDIQESNGSVSWCCST